MLFKFNSAKCVAYAKNYSMNKNPFYIKFNDEREGCNFVSQCLMAGCETLNKSNCNQWYYETESNYSQTWIDTDELIKYLLSNKTCGPSARLINRLNLSAGDVVVSCNQKMLGVVAKIENYKIFVVNGNKIGENPLSLEEENKCKFLHIIGVFK